MGKRQKKIGYILKIHAASNEMPLRWSLRYKWSRELRLTLITVMFFGLVAGSLIPMLAPSAEDRLDLIMHAAAYAFVTIVTVLLVERPLMSAALNGPGLTILFPRNNSVRPSFLVG